MVAHDDELEWFRGWETQLRVQRVDGVLVVHTAAAGPVRAGIAFRVGTADEPLPQRGLTHLVEHLALHGQVGAEDHRNGATGSTITQFVVAGSANQVVNFLNHVCAALRDLPIDRLEAERSILRVEAQRRQGSVDDLIVQLRYGAQDFARGNYREFGAETASVDEVSAWARQWFVRGNAVVWISSEQLPPGLDLRLPEGSRHPISLDPGTFSPRPVWVEGPQGFALVEAVVPRSGAAVLFSSVLSRALFRHLRVERGLSYTAAAHYEPLDADRARILVHADAETDTTSAMVDALCDILLAFREGEFVPSDVREAREFGREQARQRNLAPESFLEAAAYASLLGGTPWTPDEIDAELEALTEADLAAVAVSFWNDAIWQSPSRPASADDVIPLPLRRDEAVDGPAYVHATTEERFVFGELGLSVIAPQETFTVLFADCVLFLHWDDGGRVIVGRDGTHLQLEPTMYPMLGKLQVAKLDSAVPAHTVVRLPARPREEIPQLPSSAAPGQGAWAIVFASIFIVLGFMWIGGVIGQIGAIGDLDPDNRSGTSRALALQLILAIVALLVAGVLLWGWVQRIMWRRDQR